MLHRRDFLLGASAAAAAAAAACAPRAPLPRRPLQPTWPPFRSIQAIDAAAAPYLTYPDDLPAEELAKLLASELAGAKASGLTAVISTVAPAGRFWLDDAAFEKTKRDLATWNARIATHSHAFVAVRSGADLDAAHQSGRLGIIYTFQGTEPLGEDPDRIPMFRELGVRVIQLTHNRHNLVGAGATELGNGGLSNYGREVVARLNAEKIVVDLAHGSQRTMREGIAACKAPALISHTGCRALADLPRNTPDAELRALANKGGVAGIIFWPYLREDTQPMAIDVIRHLEHAIDVAGEDHVGIGTDTPTSPIERTPEFEKDNREYMASMVEDGIFEKGRPAELYMFIPDLNEPNRFEKLATLLAARGHSDARIAKILGGNFGRVLREVWG